MKTYKAKEGNWYVSWTGDSEVNYEDVIHFYKSQIAFLKVRLKAEKEAIKATLKHIEFNEKRLRGFSGK